MKGWLLFVPAYNCAPQLPRTLAQVAALDPADRARFAEVMVVDNGSADGGPAVAVAWAAAHLRDVPVLVVRNDANYGLGGSHKVAFQRCLDQGHAGVIVLHGDDQGRLADLLPTVIADEGRTECVLGARFMRGSRLAGYSLHRVAANVVFDLLFSIATRAALWDLGSGLNAYTRAFLERRVWEGCADDLTFNYHLIVRTVRAGASIRFVPISWREEDQVSNAKLFRHGVTMLGILWRTLVSPAAFCATDHATTRPPRTWTPA